MKIYSDYYKNKSIKFILLEKEVKCVYVAVLIVNVHINLNVILHYQ